LVTAQIIGEAPNVSGKEMYETRSGVRMYDLSGDVQLPWQNLFDAYPLPWSLPEARERADAWVFLYGHATGPLVLLGARVCAAFGVEEVEWLGWYRRPDLGCAMIAFPHPSGLNHWWNDASNRVRARDLMQAVAHGELPRWEHKSIKEES
jgi:hypothetical protein